MENWNAGEVHGAFVLKAKLDRIDKVVQAGMIQTLMWTLLLILRIGYGFYWFCCRQIVSPLRALIENISGVSEQAASTEQTTSSLQELAQAAAKAGVLDMDRALTELEAIEQSNLNVVKVIMQVDEIAFQTNSLSLNASVEAARARSGCR